MTNENVVPALAGKIAEVVRNTMAEARPRLVEAALTGRHGESVNLRHEDNFLSEHDMWMHRRYRDLLSNIITSFVYASEEAEPQVIGDNSEPDLCILVDPLDTSELAVRGLHGYTHVVVYSRTLARPIVSVVGDIFHHIELYIGARDESGRDRAFVVVQNAAPIALNQQPPKALAESLVTNYLMRPAERFMPLAEQVPLLLALGQSDAHGKARGRIGVDFGSVGLCHVAAGFTDAMIEFAKGFAIWDLLPGHYILHAAGGTVLDLEGLPVPLDYGLNSLSEIAAAMDRRQKFVAAGTGELAREILDTMANG